MKTVSILLLGLAIGLSGCSLHQRQEMEYAHYQDDAAAIREAHAAWLILSSPNRSREWPEARKKYNACIRELAAHLKEAKRKGGMDEEKRLSLPFVIEKSPYAKDSNPWFYEAIFMSDEVDPTFRLRESVTVEGMGIPLAGLAPRGGSRPHANVLKDNGNVHTLTAILDFDRMVDGKPTLRTIPRLMNEHIFIGKNKVRQPLAANFSVPIALFWKLSDADGTELLGAFRPKKAINTMGLYFSEPYDPRKIPVVFTHGLMSGPATFANLTNRLLVDPVIRENYQFWFFGYPSGLAWTIPANRQRQALKELMQEYNPRGTSREMNNIVMVGHSMGGLITRFNNSTKPWTLMKGIFELPPETFAGMTMGNWKNGLAPLNCDEHTLEQLQNNFIFSPSSSRSARRCPAPVMMVPPLSNVVINIPPCVSAARCGRPAAGCREAPADAFFQYNTRRKGMPEVRVEKNCASSTKNVGYFWWFFSKNPRSPLCPFFPDVLYYIHTTGGHLPRFQRR